jgi:hypothetical protein
MLGEMTVNRHRTPAETGVTRLQQNAGKWPVTYIDGPGALPYKPRNRGDL